jgi:hypothetical protein
MGRPSRTLRHRIVEVWPRSVCLQTLQGSGQVCQEKTEEETMKKRDREDDTPSLDVPNANVAVATSANNHSTLLTPSLGGATNIALRLLEPPTGVASCFSTS